MSRCIVPGERQTGHEVSDPLHIAHNRIVAPAPQIRIVAPAPQIAILHSVRPETTICEYPMEDDSWAVELSELMEDIRLDRAPAPGLADAPKDGAQCHADDCGVQRTCTPVRQFS